MLKAAAILLVLIAGDALACSCLQTSPKDMLAQSSDVFLAVVSRVEHRPMVEMARGSWRDSDVIVHLRLLASWKGTRADTLSLVTGSGGGDCGVEFTEKGVWIVYGHRGKDGQLYTSICERTRPMKWAQEDSIALGRPVFDRLQGRKWSAFAPPSTCPVHEGTLIQEGYEHPAAGLTPDARREFPAWSAREAPYAGRPLAPIEWKGGSVGHTFVCPLCREAANAWIAGSMEASTAPENLDLPVLPGRTSTRPEQEYRREFPHEQFAIHYQDGRNDYDSIESRFTREFGAVHDTSMKFDFSAQELDRLYEATVAARLMDIAAPHPPYPLERRGAPVRADRRQVVFVRCGIVVRQFTWYAERAPRTPSSDSEWGRLLAVYHEVQRALRSRAEVRALTPVPAIFDDALR